jgi:hypothetical protein
LRSQDYACLRITYSNFGIAAQAWPGSSETDVTYF